MKKNNNWLIIVVLIMIFSLVGATFAYLTVVRKYEGTFKVDVKTQGVDIVKYDNIIHGGLNVNLFNFHKDYAKGDVSAEATMDITLQTSKDNSNYCYNLNLILPDIQIFEHIGDGPDLTVSVYENENILLDNLDITEKTGTIPVLKNNSKFYTISANKNTTATNKYKAVVTFKYKDIDQEINNKKSYSLVLNSHLVDCQTGEKLEIATN